MFFFAFPKVNSAFFMQPIIAQKRIRVLVVDDSSVQRRMLVSLLELDGGFEVIGTASNGAEAVTMALRLLPDVITMDLRMPIMDGLAASEAIIEQAPIPILMVTSSVSKDDQRLVAKAIAAGVLAIIAKPNIHTEKHEFLRMVRGISKVKVIRRKPQLRPAPNALSRTMIAEPLELPNERRSAQASTSVRLSRAVLPTSVIRVDIVGIASSTGGPQALEPLLTRLPADYPVPVIVVQHIVEGFAPSLVEWLRPLCALNINLAQVGQPVAPGIWVAGGGSHLVVRDGLFHSSMEMPVSGQRPSGTVLFRSLVREYRNNAVGVVLSGMGDDGAAGLEMMHKAGAAILAQDEASSVIHSMPSSAIKKGVVHHVMPPLEIANTLIDFARRARPDWQAPEARKVLL
jgi:two-component system, chemotaxis family, protein-glutamate methylesterase/glutaminase